MKRINHTVFGFALLMWAQLTMAIHRNPQGTGEVLLLPYYSANNGLNTLVEVVNTTDQSKAIKINIKELFFAETVLSYNVYLGPHDSWSFALVPDNTSVDGLDGDEGVRHLTADGSCAPALAKPGVHMSPVFQFEPDALRRVREGFIEVLEMGVLTGEAAEALNLADGQDAPDCQAIEERWADGGIWDLDATADVLPASGGLSADVSLIDVVQGINYGFAAVALKDFFPADVVHHTAADGLPVSLDKGADEAWLFYDNDYKKLRFTQAMDAVNAVLMAHDIEASYSLDSIVDGRTEVILSLPTKEFMRISESSPRFGYHPPFNVDFDLSSQGNCRQYYSRSGFVLDDVMFDREAQEETVSTGGVMRPPPPPPPQICFGGVSVTLVLPGAPVNDFGTISGSALSMYYTTPALPHATENGFIRFQNRQTLPLTGVDTNSGESWQVWGIPMTGVVLQRFTNAYAGAGLLAQYGGARLIKSRSFIEPMP